MKKLIIGFVLFCWCGLAAASTIHAKKNEAYILVFAMLDELAPGDFKSTVTVTDTCKYSDAGGSWTTLSITDTTSEMSLLGVYAIDLTAAEMNHDRIMCKLTGTGAVDNMLVIDTYAVDIDDLVRSTTPANTLNISAGGIVEANLKKINGDLTSVTDLKDFVDAGYDPATDKIQGVVLVDANTDMLTTAEINTEVDNAIETYHLDHLLAVDYDPASPPGVATALLNELIGDDGAGVSEFTTGALANAGGGGGATAEEVADAVWDELVVAHAVEGSYGKYQYDETYLYGVTFYWDTAASDDTGNGLTETTAKKTWSAVLALVTSGRGDTIVMVNGSSNDAEITMNKDDLRLTCSHPQQCTLTKTTGSTTTTLTMSADRMILEDIRLDATSSGTVNNALLVTGEDCVVRGCLFSNVDDTSITITGNRTHVDRVTLYEYSDSFTPGIDEVQTIAITGTPTAGTWTITCDNNAGAPTTTGTIAWDDTNTEVNAALDAAFAASAIVASGTFMSAQALTFSGTGYTKIDKDMCDVDITSLTGATGKSVVETIKGVPDIYDKSPGIFIDGTAALEGVVISNSRFAGSGGSVTNAIALDGANLTQTVLHNNVFQDIAAGYAVAELSSGPSYSLVYNNADALSKGYTVLGMGAEVVNSHPYATIGSDMNLTGSAIADLWDENTVLHTATDTFGKLVNDLTINMALERDDTVLILGDTAEIQGKLPTGTISNFDETTDPVELIDSGGSAGTSADELVDDVWDEAASGHVGGGSFGLRTLNIINDTAVIQPLSVTTDAAVNHVAYGNAQLVRSTTPANTLDVPISGAISANVTEISGDAPAADALETMLDGTGGNKLSLSQLLILADSGDHAVSLTGIGTGSALFLDGGVGAVAIEIAGSSAGGIIIHSQTSGWGVSIDSGVTIQGTDNKEGLSITGGVGVFAAVQLVGGSGGGSGIAIQPVNAASIALGGDISGGNFDGDVIGSVASIVATVVTDTASRTASKADVTNLDVAVSTRSSHNAADVWAVGTRVLSSVATIVDGVWDELISGHATIDTFGSQLGTVVDAVLVDTAQIQGKLPVGTIADQADVTSAITSYDVAKQGEKMDIVDAPNATAVTAIQSGLSTFAVGEAVTLTSNAITTVSIADGAITTIKVATPSDFMADLSGVSTFDSTSNKVTLDNTAHGGIASTMTLERVIVKATVANKDAVELVGVGTGNGLSATGGATGNGIVATGGATAGHGLVAAGVATGHGFRTFGGSTSGDGINATLGGSGVDIRGGITGGMTGNVTGNMSGSVGSVTSVVTTDAASRTASKADVSALATSTALTTVDTVVDGIQTDLDNGTDGLGAIKNTADAVETDTQDLQTQIGTAGAGLTDLGGMSVAMKAEIETEADDAIVLNHLDHLLAEDYDPVAIPGTPTALLNEIFENDGGTPRFTANTLELSPSGGASAAVIADAVWNELATGHTDAGKAGQQVWTDMDAVLVQVDAIKAETTLIVADTNELQTDDIPLQLSNLNDTSAAEVWAAVTRTTTGGTIDTNVDMRGTDSAALASVVTEIRMAELDAVNLPTDVAAIPTTPERGTDDAALAVVCTVARLAELDAANLPADVAAIPTTPERGTDSAALASVCTELRLAELDAANLPTSIDAIPTTAMRGTDLASTHTAAGVWAEATRTVTGGTINLNTTEKGTDNAALATVCTELRLIELDAGNLPATADAILIDTGVIQTHLPLGIAIDDAAFALDAAIALGIYDAPTKAELDAGFAGISTHAASDVVTAIFARVGDGLTFSSAFDAIQAVLYGRTTRVGNVVTFYKNDDVSPKVTATVGPQGTRSDVTVLP